MVVTEMHEVPGQPWSCCPRAALTRALHALGKEYGLTLRVGFEHEFYLLRAGSAPYPQVRMMSLMRLGALAVVLQLG